MSSDQNFLPAASSSPLAHMSVKAFANSCVFMTANPFLRPAPRNCTDLIATFPRRRQTMASNAADALLKTHARHKKSFALFHHKWFTPDRIAIACTYRASVRLAAERAAVSSNVRFWPFAAIGRASSSEKMIGAHIESILVVTGVLTATALIMFFAPGPVLRCIYTAAAPTDP